MDLGIGEIVSKTTPVFCFPEFIEKLPISLTYCFLYMLGCVFVIGFGFYLYFRRILMVRNGYSNDEQNSVGQLRDSKILRGMFRGGQNTEMREVSIINGGESRPVI